MILALSLASQPVLGQPPAGFRSSADLTLSASDALHRFTLPLEAYRDARGDLADLRVLNGAGEQVPFALAGEEARPRLAAYVPLRAFPVFGVPGTTGIGDLDVSVRTRSDGTVISVQPRSGAAPGAGSGAARQPAAWLLDASAISSPVQALIVEWEPGPGTEVVRVDVEGSDDLRSWTSLTRAATLVRVEQGGEALSQPRVEIPARRVRYLRIAGESPAFRLRQVRAELVPEIPPVPREVRRVTGTAGPESGEYVFDLGARLPVESVRLLLPSGNTVAPVTILARQDDRDEWRRVITGSFYRLTRGGVEVESPTQEVDPLSARQWMVRVDARSGGIGSGMPSLEVSWRPAQVVFVARGEPPFRVAFGKSDAPRVALMVPAIIPGYEPDAEHRLPVAAVGEVTSVALKGDGWRRVFGEGGARRAALWAVLVTGVLVLGLMAWRLSRQMS